MLCILFSMKTIITDLEKLDKSKFNIGSNDFIINTKECRNSCIGCFSCWIKHPTHCIYKDNYSNMTEKLKQSDELIIISKSRYGCYSECVKRVLERCIGYVLPYFTIRNKMIHHASRYKKRIKFKAYFYGNINDNDRFCLYDLVKANSINLNAEYFDIKYIDGEDYVYIN